MNKIILGNKLKVLTDNGISVDYTEAKEFFDISKLIINIDNSDSLYFEFDIVDQKYNVEFNVSCDCSIYLLCKGSNLKIKYQYNINNNCSLNVFKYNQVNNINEMSVIDLNKEQASINYIFKSISVEKENYDYVVHHNYPYTSSSIINNGVNKSGTMNIQISGDIPKNIVGCNCTQVNRIINLTKNKCEINPNLYINCDDVVANHSALIGQFNDDEIFYLNSRGISKIDATNLLIKGFLLNKMDNNILYSLIKSDIDKYWR